MKGRFPKRGVGSNQYVDKLPGVDQINEVEGIRRLQESVGNGAPSMSAQEFRDYKFLEDAHVSSLNDLVAGSFDRNKVEANSKAIADTQDRILGENPNSYGLAMVRAAKMEAVAKVSGEKNPLSEETGVLYAQMQGEYVEDEDLAGAIGKLTNSTDRVDDLPLYLAVSSSTSGDLKERVEFSNQLRQAMSEKRVTDLLSSS